MNFELADKLYILLETKKLDKAISLAETELKNIPKTEFHKIIGKNLLHQVLDLKNYLKSFDESTTVVLKKKQGFLKNIFGSKEETKPVAYYCEMNGFTINYDRWYIDLFSFEKYSLEEWDWLSDFYDSTANDMTITGFEEIQNIFQEVHEKDRFNEPNIDKAYEVCEMLVILRLQELFREIYINAEDKWTKIPMFVTAHDYDLIYRPN
jgi:hypothetical protein